MNVMARVLVTFILLSASLAGLGNLRAADWPTHGHDLARSGVTDEALAVPLHRQWVHRAAYPPKPAWPEPGREVHRLAFDYAYDVTVANGIAYYGSSADHKVYALELETGRPRWSFFTEGPVRFAPAIDDGRVFVASDDGWLYGLSAADGSLRWRFHGGPRDERMLGNQQMISRWPLRSGVAVEDGIVYFSAGMWPSEGVFFYALKADSGEVLWKNDTSGTEYLNQPHPPSDALTGVAPQGYLLGHADRLFLPTGRNVPAAYDRCSGDFLYYHSRPDTWGDRWGGSWSMLAEGLLFSWRCDVLPDCNVQLGECMPDKDDGLVAFDAKTGMIRRDCPGKRGAVVKDGTIYLSGSGSVDAYDFRAWTAGKTPTDGAQWSTPHGRAYSMILAGQTLVVGGQETVTAIAADSGKVVWQDEVQGQVRSLALADGRLVVSTTTGEITCYGPEAVDQPPTVSSEADISAFADVTPDSPAAAAAHRVLECSGKKAGYCLVLGAGDGRFLYSLAKQSGRQIYCVEPDADKVAAARRALDQAHVYGVNVVIHQGSLREVIYPDYFADLVVLGEAGALSLEQLPVAQIYRVLRPCGGTICVVTDGSTGQSEAVSRWLKEAKVPDEEIAASAGTVQVVRGRLPAVGDWTHEYANAAKSGCSTDQRVRLPLKLLWFGEPGPERLIARHWRGPAPLCVGGRMFVIGQYSLMAVDAYNGRSLWRRDLEEVGRFPVNRTGSNVAADEDSVYLATGNVCLRLDATTGETVHTYAIPLGQFAFEDGASRTSFWSHLAVGRCGILGSIGEVEQSRGVFLLTKEGKPLWTYTAGGVVGSHAISLDDERVYLIDQMNPEAVARAKRRGENLPATWTLVALDAATGKIAWQTQDGIAGCSELWLADGVLLATGGNRMSGFEASSGKLLYNQPAAMNRFPVIVGNTIYGEPSAYDLHTGKPILRKDPFTGAESNWRFARSYGCGSISAGPNLLMFRSGTLGMVDLADDTGVHNFGGVRAGCHINAIAAAGLLLMPVGDASCTCSYCFQATVALVPTQKQENWSVFYDRLPTTSVRRAALNLGAPGDQRDAEGTLWLAEPRPKTVNRRPDIAVPFRFIPREGFEPYQANADLVTIEGTDRPWVYTSGLKGAMRAEFDLEILDRGFPSWPASPSPTVDGTPSEPCWDGYRAVPIGGEDSSVTLRHDDENLYVAYRRPAAVDSTGKPVPWKKATAGEDAPVWADDSFELFLSNVNPDRSTPSHRYLHLGLSASGARHDALWTYVTPGLPELNIPRLEVKIDGETGDWADKGLEVVSLPGPMGVMRSPDDLDSSIRIGWNEEGVVLLVRVKDNVIRVAEEGTPLDKSDSVELYVTPKRGSAESCQLVIAPPADAGAPATRSQFTDHRKETAGESLSVAMAAKREPGGYFVEVCLPWKNLKMTPATGMEFGLQLFVNDDDNKDKPPRFQSLWHPAGAPVRDPLAYQTLRLADQPSPPVKFTRSEKPERQGLYRAVPPHPFPVILPPLGAQGEDAGYAAAWSGQVKADDSAFVVELAIPWQTLAQAGLSRDQLMVNVDSRGPLPEPPMVERGFERLMVVSKELDQPRTVSVRLHFAELEGAKPGERVFDVKLQDKVVLENFDIATAAGGSHRAVVKQFDGIVAARAITLELLPKASPVNTLNAPTLCGVEILTTEPGRK